MYQCNNRTSGETDVLETEPDIKQHENTCNDQCLDRIGTHLITDGRTNTLAYKLRLHQHQTCPPASDLLLHVRSGSVSFVLIVTTSAAKYGGCLDGIIINNLCYFRYNLVLYLFNGYNLYQNLRRWNARPP